MIDTIVNTVTNNVEPLSFVIGLAFGVLADEAGRKMFRKMADERINQVLGNSCSCDECDECSCSGGESKLSLSRSNPSDSEGGKN